MLAFGTPGLGFVNQEKVLRNPDMNATFPFSHSEFGYSRSPSPLLYVH